MKKLKKSCINLSFGLVTFFFFTFIVLAPLSEKNYQEALEKCKESPGDDLSLEIIMYSHGFFFGGVLDSKPNLIEMELAFINKHLKIFN